jgi:hypothetical protein
MNPASAILVKMAIDTGRSTFTEFDLFVLARQLFHDRGYRGEAIAHRNGPLTARRAKQLVFDATYDSSFPVSHLGSSDEETYDRPGRLRRDVDFTSILFSSQKADAETVMMAADPFCYLSHASALDAHQLSIAAGTDLHFTAPERVEWRLRAESYMSNALGFSVAASGKEDLPFLLTRPQPNPVVRGRRVHRHETQFPMSQSDVAAPLRVAPIGMTFRDTLAAPAWCGGMAAVVAIWRRHARAHAEEIIIAISACREKIVRVRAGYLLEEFLEISDPRIAAWTIDAQRGSSRKLDPAGPYASRFSARWMISINVTDEDLPATTAA